MTFIKNNNYVLVALALIFLFSFLFIKKLEHEVLYEEIIVYEGDTLWAYSQEFGGNMPTEQWIDEIIKLNQLTSTNIQTGEKLKIPLKQIHFEQNDIATNAQGDKN